MRLYAACLLRYFLPNCKANELSLSKQSHNSLWEAWWTKSEICVTILVVKLYWNQTPGHFMLIAYVVCSKWVLYEVPFQLICCLYAVESKVVYYILEWSQSVRNEFRSWPSHSMSLELSCLWGKQELVGNPWVTLITCYLFIDRLTKQGGNGKLVSQTLKSLQCSSFFLYQSRTQTQPWRASQDNCFVKGNELLVSFAPQSPGFLSKLLFRKDNFLMWTNKWMRTVHPVKE